jgi:hypothetical protein
MGWIIAAVVGFACLSLGGWLAKREYDWLHDCQFTRGVVIENIPVKGSKGGYTYRPKISFRAVDGVERTFTSSGSSKPPQFAVGETVRVAYRAGVYEGRLLTFGHRYGAATFLAVIGLATMTLAGVFLSGPRMMSALYPP